MVETGISPEIQSIFQSYAIDASTWSPSNQDDVRVVLLEQFTEEFGPTDSTIETIFDEAVLFIRSRVDHWRNRVSQQECERKTNDLIASFPQSLFYMPSAVNALYAHETPSAAAWIVPGVETHCTFIRRASAQVCRRYQESIRHLPIDLQTIEEELYSCALEEVVKSLSDSHARVWNRATGECLLIPPTRRRGWKSIIIARVAMSADGKQVSTLRSDGHMGLWSLSDGELIHTWDLSGYASDSITAWHAPMFSRDGKRIAWQVDDKRVVVIEIGTGEQTVFDKAQKSEFARLFGQPILLQPTEVPEFTTEDRWNRQMPFQLYTNEVLHWCVSLDGHWVATGSETTRGMPQWMRDIGFQNAVYHILKRRLIDTIRKQTHTTSVQTEAEPSEDESPEKVSLGAYQIDTPVEDLVGGDQAHIATAPDSDWSDEHDLQRMLAVLQTITITYKDRTLTCDQLAQWKAEGLTNADIGEKLGIPRGTVDYLWNQCKEQIQLIFGDTLM